MGNIRSTWHGKIDSVRLMRELEFMSTKALLEGGTVLLLVRSETAATLKDFNHAI